ncbi:MAG: L-serine ammonia-lyase, iron-sulfur-dependent subunit beta [Bacillota bacterium]|nr:L-serine ammonia-lyase, iron-sulfur-dependent subunit beta [Bacillota bacterium]MDW7678537.1 L-serine ammonia-lyase, iron-sulfur-dependent subunit beta [Bacillota bacterium]
MKKLSAFDMIGPVMTGPSSSHTAGALRIALIASRILKETVVSVDFLLYGSFSDTYKGHGTDRALVAGIMGLPPDDPGVRSSLEKAAEKGIQVSFSTHALEPQMHPNTVALKAVGTSGRTLQLEGASIGGGEVVINRINGIEVCFTGEYPTLIIQQQDRPGIAAHITSQLAGAGINIGTMRMYRHDKGNAAFTILETDEPVAVSIIEAIGSHPAITDVFLIAFDAS